MVTALIFAGGTGVRMNAHARPKQFLELHGKPLIIYTLEHFEQHPLVDNILVVCLENWVEELRLSMERFFLKKTHWIIPGGKTAHESIYLGLLHLREHCGDEDIVLIHDGVRPLIEVSLIDQCIQKASQFGAAITVAPATESVAIMGEGDRIEQIPLRSKMFSVKAPQAFQFSLVMEAYQRADKEQIRSVDTAHLLSIYGYPLHTVRSNPYNIKITSPSDYYIFRALYDAMENSQIFGL